MQSFERHVRPLKREDLTSIMAVIDATGLFEPELLTEMTKAYFAGEAKEELWLTYNDGSPAAVVYCSPERMTHGTWNLLLLAVHPDQQGRGIGTALVQHVQRRLSERTARVLLVETSGLESFEKTRSFYRRIGFIEEARIREFYRAGEDKIIFHKSL